MTRKRCSICELPAFGHGWCEKHDRRWYRHGDPLYVRRNKRYTMRVGGGRLQYEHRLVAGCTVGDGKVVHHLDGNKHNNHPSNLQVLDSLGDHRRIHGGTR